MIDLGKKKYGFADLREIMLLLRSPEGCPWDRAQSHASIRRYLIEEAYEAADAIDRTDDAALCEELGDVLLQVVFHAAIAAEDGAFSLDDVCDGICRKMIHRHPALFGGTAQGNWEEIKQARFCGYADAMEHIATALPALTRAEKIERKAAEAGFVWPEIGQALDKVAEETSELRRAAAGEGDPQEELGDLLLAAADAGRMLGLDPERALEEANRKFVRRFARMEALADGALDAQPLSEQLRLWQRAKEDVDHGKSVL